MTVNDLIKLAKKYEKQLPEFQMAAVAERPIERWIDHTLLKPDATPEQIKQICADAVTWNFAAVCVNPVFVPLVTDQLTGSQTAVCTVVGFPLGASITSTKVYETRKAIHQGATEVDMVIPIGLLKAGMLKEVLRDIRTVTVACHQQGVLIKVIIETALLTTHEKILACLLIKEAGADFVKTSTGFAASGATVEDVELMRRVVGPELGVKAAGGVRSLADARGMLAAGATRLGTSNGVKIMQELKQG